PFRATPSTDSPSLFGTLIHSCYSKTQRPALGQIWIGAVGQYWIGANSTGIPVLAAAILVFSLLAGAATIPRWSRAPAPARF
ncbi:hypothetical protein, partial [Janthinobacterium sp.]|uniref:hypothetical protein n=1 Tax=Janthinobacterium sp. TaxID=1871054 RepID=UPI00293D4128